MNYVFHNNQVVLQFELMDQRSTWLVPRGSYVLLDHAWYYKMKVSLVPINLCDIPKEIKTLCLLLGISI